MNATPVYRKQEQEPADEEIIEVAPGVLRLQLPISLPGLGHVNCYALEDGDGFALVDPGLPGEESWQALMRRLDAAGIPLRRVHTAVVTHSHPDHFGGSEQLKEEAGAEVLTHESFRSMVAESSDDIDRDILDASDEDVHKVLEIWKERIRNAAPTPWGTRREPPPDEALLRFINSGGAGGRRFFAPHPTVRVADGEPVMLAGREWRSVHTPGHTDDHLCLYDPTEGVLLSGDHVLPTITPHIAGSATDDDALATFFASLERVAALEGVRQVLPAHGHPFSALAERTDEIRVHHDERLQLLRDAATEHLDAPVEAWMRVLFKERSWGEMAMSETYAHLAHLDAIDDATSRRDDDGLLRFTLAT